MLRDSFLAFDDDVLDYSVAGRIYSEDRFSLRLGAWDQTYVFISVFNPIFNGLGGTIDVTLEHSGDAADRPQVEGGGRVVWEQKPIDLNASKFTLAEWNSGIPYAWGFDWGTVPKLRFARLGITATSVGGLFLGGRVRVHVALRDSGSGHPFGLPHGRK
jgi:hypothetical protein